MPQAQSLTSRERIMAALEHREADRVPITESMWGTTVARWHREGLPEGQTPQSYFGLETVGVPVDLTFQIPAEVVEQTDEYVVRRTEYGRLQKTWRHMASTPELLDFPVKCRSDWEEHKHLLEWNESRVDWDNLLEQNQRAAERGDYIKFGGRVGYQAVTTFCPCEVIWVAMAEDPDWVSEMIGAVTDLTLVALHKLAEHGCHLDAVSCSDDLGYRNGTFFSTPMFRDIVMPHHERYCDAAKHKGLKTHLHSCGNVLEFVPSFIEAGYDALNPLEVKAGMDLLWMKREYGQDLCLVGGIDVRSIADPDPAKIEEEIRAKVPVAKEGGGYIFHSDHSIPDSVSFERYQRVVELALECGSYN